MSKICSKIHQLVNTLPKLHYPFSEANVPYNGIYILFEKGEIGHSTSRIVRIGSHTGSNQLRSRLYEHYLKENKDRSILRKNIGRAILNRDNDPYLKLWEIDLTSKQNRDKYGSLIDWHKQNQVEQMVSKYIHTNFTFVTLRIDDKGDREYLESRLISTVAQCSECGPSSNWLGLLSPKEKIRESGLWQVNKLHGKTLTDEDLLRMKEIIQNGI
jgi:hypothetical protein